MKAMKLKMDELDRKLKSKQQVQVNKK